MEILIDLLKSAKGEIIAGILFALLGWVYSRFRRLTRLYKRQKQELERMTNEMNQRGITKQECERLQEALKQAEAQHQEDLQRITELQNQLEAQQREHEKLKAELIRKEEELKQFETQQAELQQELEREKSRKRIPPMSDEDFIELCKSGDAEKVEKAIMNGANVNAKTKDGYTALMEAIRQRETDVVELLLKNGADVNAKKDEDGSTALMLAPCFDRTDNTEVAELLLKNGANVNAKWRGSLTALMLAAHFGRTENAKVLLKHGANVNAKDYNGRTALMEAKDRGHTETADLLREYGAEE